jgi:DNA polymerase-1
VNGIKKMQVTTETEFDIILELAKLKGLKNLLEFDIEGDGLLPELTTIHCVVIRNYRTGGKRRYGPDQLEEAWDILSKADMLIGHNIIGYDLPAIDKVCKRQFRRAYIYDTLVASKFFRTRLKYEDMNDIADGKYDHLEDGFKVYNSFKKQKESAIGRHSLEAWGIRLGYSKGEFSKDADWTKYTPEMLDYCENDVDLNHLQAVELNKSAYEGCLEPLDLEMKVQAILSKQERYGVKFDVDAGEKLWEELKQIRTELLDKLSGYCPGWHEKMKTPEYYFCILPCGTRLEQSTKGNLASAFRVIRKNECGTQDPDLLKDEDGKDYTYKYLESLIQDGPLVERHTPFNPGSAHHVQRFFKEKYNFDVPVNMETGQPLVNTVLLKSVQDDFPEAKLIVRYEVVQDRIEKLAEGKNGGYLTFQKSGRLHHYCNSIGTITYRGAHYAPNLGQVPSVNYGEDGILKGEAGGWGYEFRKLFTASEGRCFIGTDASGQELRCLGAAMAQFDNGAYAQEVVSGDVHTKNQQAAELPTRDNAKTFIYGLIYGAGDEKTGAIVGKDAHEGRRLKDNFFRAIPALKETMEYYKRAFRNNEYFEIKGYRFKSKTDKSIPLDILSIARSEDGWKRKIGFVEGFDGRRVFGRAAYSALNAYLQSLGAILTKRWMVIIHEHLEKKGLFDFYPTYNCTYEVNQVMWVHDEMQFDAEPQHKEYLEKLFPQAMKETEQYYNFKCELDADTASGHTWEETH